jgi:hypothetical protein
MWEFEWYKAFHMLRDGIAVPGTRALGAAPMHISRVKIREWVRQLKEMDEEEYLTINDLACEKISGEQHSHNTDDVTLWWARGQRESEIAELEKYLNPSKIPEEARRRELWKALWQATTVPTLKKLCDQWADLQDVRRQGLAVFPNHVLANANEFLRMKKDKRFPRSDSPLADEPRLEYLARGMAGIMANVSPMTGIERLRNMQHTEGGPLWRGTKLPEGNFAKGTESCQCWRCGLDRSRPAYKTSSEAWWNGMASFMEIVESKRTSRARRGQL